MPSINNGNYPFASCSEEWYPSRIQLSIDAWKESKMTILGAFDCEDYLLFASDSLATDLNIPYQVIKQANRLDPHMIWWFSGSETLGVQFNWWLNGLDFTQITNWEEFIPQASEKVAKINEERLNDAKRLLKTPESMRSDLISILLVGYLGGKREILEIGDDNSYQAHLSIKSAFAGDPVAKAQAITVLRTLQGLDGNDYPQNAATLKKVMEVVAANNTHCGPPIRIWELSSSGIKECDE